MKTSKQLALSLFLTLIFSAGLMAQYCIPPGFKSMGGTGEPFTYISNVQLEGLNNSTGMPTGIGEDNGYTYYSSAKKPVLLQGSSYSLKVSGVDNLGAGMEVVVWIDWDGDGILHQTAERVAYWAPNGNHGADITVPKNAPNGVIRMRVYCDMPSTAGHIPPEPCGYLNYPTHPIGQHGEVEDYDIIIGTPTGINNTSLSEQIEIYPNPANHSLTIEHPMDHAVEYFVSDVFGRKIMSGALESGSETLNVSNLAVGQYILLLNADSNQIRKQFHISR